MKILYLDAFSGISGDMTVGALLSLGMPLEHLRAELSKLALAGYQISASPRMLHGIAATKFDVAVDGDGHQHDHDHETHPHVHLHRAFRATQDFTNFLVLFILVFAEQKDFSFVFGKSVHGHRQELQFFFFLKLSCPVFV